MKKEDYLFDLEFLERFSVKPVFLLLSGCFVCGAALAGAAVKVFSLLHDRTVLPLFFSGIPPLGSGFLPCFSSILLNGLIGLIILFLLGVTAFGAFGIPALMVCKGASVALSVLFLLDGKGLPELWRSAVCFTPSAAAVSLLLILFATRAFIFSGGLARAGFSRHQETLNFQLYFKDFMCFLCFFVAVSVIGGLLATLYGVF